MSKEKEVRREILEWIEKETGNRAEFIPEKGRHSKVRCQIHGTSQEFPVPDKDFRAGSAKKNFYSQMRRKINERVEAVKARQTVSA